MPDKIFTEAERIEALKNLQPTGEKKRIKYNHTDILYDVYEIPLEYLIYNAHNGRIRSLTRSHEAQYLPLNAQLTDDKNTIEQFLYDSAKAKNDKTIESIENTGQQEFGIITKDGVIIDGNRRAMILNHINKKNNTKLNFKAVILKDKLIDNRKEIITLETSYQMGVDSKVDYNPIEKYIRCKELQEFYTVGEIAEKMAEDPKKVQEWLDILSLMEEYLVHLKTPGTYIRLEKREGHFVDLFKYLKSYNGKNNQSVDWAYSDADVEDMKLAYFSYIRLGIPVAKTRVIARPANGNSFFCYEDIWKEFIVEHKSVVEKVPEIDFTTLKETLKEENNTVIIEKIDSDWRDSVESEMDDNLFYYEGVLGDRQNELRPLRLLKRAKSTLYQIDIGILKDEMDDEKKSLINDIDTIVQSFKKLY
ncbi:MAG: hypothetical protein JWR05_719 [Mucilaginibacter sp.]|nr:hypothetical protein [Mucilaginibacter sp.]